MQSGMICVVNAATQGWLMYSVVFWKSFLWYFSGAAEDDWNDT